MDKIEFSIHPQSDNILRVDALESSSESDEREHKLNFKLPAGVEPGSNLIALALSTLCGKRYAEIDMNLPVNEYCRRSIADFTGARVRCDESSSQITTGTNICLNFSGGFDSLACKMLLPEDTKLVSMDFGGNFSRERVFFEQFETNIVETNLLSTGLQRNSWSFMGIGSILLQKHLGLSHFTFGNILEAAPANFLPSLRFRNPSFPPFAAAGMTAAPVAIGLTEIGTILIASSFGPKHIASSLQSLAGPNDSKMYRKYLLAKIVESKSGLNYSLPEVNPPQKPWFSFGKSFADDFLSCYIIKNLGAEVFERAVSEIPVEILRLAEECSLDFYERFNTNFYYKLPHHIRSHLYGRLETAGVQPYSERDWQEFTMVRSALSKFYPALA